MTRVGAGIDPTDAPSVPLLLNAESLTVIKRLALAVPSADSSRSTRLSC